MTSTSCTLHISGSEANGYTLTLLEGKPGASGVPVSVPITGASFAARSGVNPGEVVLALSENNRPVDDLKKLGMKLADLLLKGPVGDDWRKLQAQTVSDHDDWKQGGALSLDDEPMLRTYLRIDPPELQHLPWETCWLRSGGIFFDRAFPVVRAWKSKLDNGKLAEDGPIRILAVIGTNDKNLGAVDEVFEIWRSLREAEHSFDVEIFDCSSIAPGQDVIGLLKERLRALKPHVFHFAGHAYYPEGALQLKPGSGIAVAWAPDDIRAFFKNEVWVLRLVYLNACRTQKPVDQQDSVTAAFADAGALSAVTMLGNISGEEAGVSAASIYKSLAEGFPLDRALAFARAKLGAERKGAFYPVFGTRMDPDRIIRYRSQITESRQEELRRHARNDEISLFVDRREMRRSLMGFLSSDLPKVRRHAVAVHGNLQYGKSWLLKWCLHTFAWHDHPVIYTRLEDYRKWRELLQSWAKGGSDPVLKYGLSPESVRDLPTALGGAGDLETNGTLPNAIEKVLEALRANVGGKPLVLAVDHFQSSDARESLALDTANFIQYVFNPIALGDGRLRLIVSYGSDALFQTQELDGKWERLSLGPFPAGCNQLMREWFMAKGGDNWRKAEAYIGLPINNPLSAGAFGKYCEGIWGIFGGL